MKHFPLLLIILFMMNTACTQNQNPFFEQYKTPHGTVPFNQITLSDYEPAFTEGMKQQTEEIERIIRNSEAPTFENTIVALEKSGELLERVSTVFFNLNSAETSDEMQALAQEIIPALTAHGNSINLNEELFQRIKAVYDQKEKLVLSPEQQKLLHDTYTQFIRRGANLTGEAKEKYKELSTKLSTFTLQFSERNLKENNAYKMVITNQEELSGLPESTIEAAELAAKENNMEGWVFTLDAPSYAPFMKYAENRELRKELYLAYNTKCTLENEYNTEELIRQIVNTRREIAQLFNQPNYAAYSLERSMAEKPEAVYDLLNELLVAYTPEAKKEVEAVSQLAQSIEGKKVEVMPWDWAYYSNKLMEQSYNLNDEQLRPYFELSKVKEGVFGLATTLYGITFKKNANIPVYHKEVDAYEVFDKDGAFLAVLYTDFHPRAGKRSGAWMTEFKAQWTDDNGENSRPHVTLVMNFTKPTADKPALLTFYEVETFLHEFGHGLHGMLSNVKYESQSGTNVYRDFVELPSQLMENFAIEPEFLHTFAKHYQTGETIPNDLIERIKATSNFNVATQCLRQLSFGLLDMAWHTLEQPFEGDVKAFEKKAWAEAQYLPAIEGTCMSTQFSHIFAGGYAAGYYSYKWSEVLDADAFALFKEKGIFSQEVSQSFRDNILSKGGTKNPMELYVAFRGQKPSIDALLIRNGIKK